MDPYLNGEKLIGDDYDLSKIKEWYDSEVEGYANLGSKNKSGYTYIYHEMNKLHGFNKLKNSFFNNVLGIGSAYGHEFYPIIHKIKNLTIIEPSDNLRSDQIGNIKPKYVKPEIDGKLLFDDHSFDLITCFGTLHHVPNVSTVVKELIRVLSPGGYLLVREPVISMGNWNMPRRGLTKNERGIPIKIFDEMFMKQNVSVISREFCFTLTPTFLRVFRKFSKKSLLTYKGYVQFDRILSRLLKFNLNYHPHTVLERLRPSNIFYVVKKNL